MKVNKRDPFERPLPLDEPEPQLKPRFIPRSLQQKTPASEISGSTPASAGASARNLTGMPEMQFRGFMSSGDDKAGLLEIVGMGTYVVHEGDKVGLQQGNGDMVVRVIEINALNLIVEFGSLGEKVVVQ